MSLSTGALWNASSRRLDTRWQRITPLSRFTRGAGPDLLASDLEPPYPLAHPSLALQPLTVQLSPTRCRLVPRKTAATLRLAVAPWRRDSPDVPLRAPRDAQ